MSKKRTPSPNRRIQNLVYRVLLLLFVEVAPQKLPKKGTILYKIDVEWVKRARELLLRTKM